MRLALLIFQSLLLFAALIAGAWSLFGSESMILAIFFLLLIVGITNYLGSTLLKFSRVRNKRLINIHWYSATVFLLLWALGLALKIQWNHTLITVILMGIPWLFPLLFWYILYLLYKRKL